MSDPGFTLENVLRIAEILGVIGGGTIVMVGLGRTTGRLEAAIKQQADEIKIMRDDIREINKVLSLVAVQATRLDVVDQRLQSIDNRYEDLRRGNGWMLSPVAQANRGS
jgi:acyl carrier protein phosphodiesterase